MDEKTFLEKMNAFIGKLTSEQIREQLALAYLHMERCNRVLKGEADIEPVTMIDNGESTELELFYSCVKNVAEIGLLNDICGKPDKE